MVVARDEHGAVVGTKRVVETYRRVSDHLRILTFQDDTGQRQQLKTTDDHPFWVVARRTFVDAGALQVGDQVIGPQGELQAVATTSYEPHPEGVDVYNFQVKDFHTYYVRQHPDANPLLVHNADYTPETTRIRHYTNR